MNAHKFRVVVGVTLLAGCLSPVLAQQYPAPADAYDTSPDPAAANLAPIEQSQLAPPPLPVYVQPPAPADGYMWVPGYWALNRIGYYWVPGAWVLAPYTGALWTPGYWGYTNGIYLWNGGYWGPHVGFYGGINYGFGYIGTGYVGGYWNHDRFYYNRSITNVNTVYVRNVYDHRVRFDDRGPGRVSYHGGPNGIGRGPDPHEMAARGERHMPPTDMQRQYSRQAGGNQGQFFNHNQGRPAQAAIDHPVGGPGAAARPGAGMGAGQNFAPRSQGAESRPAGSNRQDQPPPNRNGGNSMTQERQASAPRPAATPSQPSQQAVRPAAPNNPAPSQERPTFNSERANAPARPSAPAAPAATPSSAQPSHQARPSFNEQASRQARPQQNAAPSHAQQAPQQGREHGGGGGGSREREAGNKGEARPERGGNGHD